jgi:sigma-B regulation protein RsbU (phosphoserine phosphatase)
VPLLLTLPVLIVVVVLSTVAYLHSREAAEDLASQNLNRIHAEIGRHMGSLLNMPRRINHINEGLIRQGKLDPGDLWSWRETYFRQAQAFDMVSAIVWGSEAGETMWVALYAGDDHLTFTVKDDSTGGEAVDYRMSADGQIGPEPKATYPFDPRVRPWYIAPMAAGEAAWSEPFGWIDQEGGTESGTLGIAYGQPYRNAEGQIIGVVDADLSLQDISRFLEQLSVGKSGVAFVMDPGGLMIANSAGAPVVGPDTKQVAAAASADPHIARAAAHLAEALPSLDAIDEPYEASVNVNGQRCLLIASPFNHETGLSWTIVTVVPERDFLAEVQAGRRRSMVYGLAAVGGTIVLGLVVAFLMVRPVLLLADHVRVIGEGNLDVELRLTQSPEMVQLSNEINDMTEGLRDRLALKHALGVAMEVQQNLLPAATPQIDGLDIAGRSTYCDETGGDYYDYLDVIGLSKDTVAAAIGDVSGHGIAAAMLMATARGILVGHCDQTGSLGELLTHLNTHLVKVVGPGRFMTMLLMMVDIEHKEVRWASAGHDPPFVYDPASDAFLDFGLGDIPLGVLAGQVYEEYVFHDVQAGQIFLAGTDGIWEADDLNGEMYGKDRLRELIRASADLTAEEISNRLREDLTRFRGESSQHDDITFVIVKVDPAP